MAQPAAPFRIELEQVASQIYVDLVSRNVAIEDGKMKMSTSAENLAKLSFKLAAVFETVQDELNAEGMPKNVDFTPEVADIAAWLK